ncbi:PilZ domain-containing protein [Pelagibacterium halotolerans]|uniref:PilZ domain-containing protein n=1 Tax=Pelagibacterium halotolerans TaxID=531813 RepID=UPI00384D86A8
MRGSATVRLEADTLLDDRLRHLANMPGRYYLEKWRDKSGRKVSSFACRIQRISPQTVTLSAPVSGDVGDWVVMHFDEFGILRGKIVRPLGFGFVISLKMSDAQRARLAAKVLWAERRRNFEVSEMRRHKRIVPRNPESVLILADGSRVGCFVIDMSASGVAVSADIHAEIGLPLAVGSVVGRVVRQLDPGFAVEFVEPVVIEELEARIIRPQSVEREVG